MKHTMQIKHSHKHENKGIATIRQTSIYERFFRFIFGDKVKLTVIVPGDSVDEINITENPEVINEGDSK